jgi:hypothetical protein
MHLLLANMAALAVASIYYAWRAYDHVRKQRQLRERVAYMLWVMAQQPMSAD